MARLCSLMMAACMIVVAAGCDEGPRPRPVTVNPATRPAEQPKDTRPKMEQLLAAPRTTLQLPGGTLSIEAPPGWQTHTVQPQAAGTAPIHFLQGPIPNGPLPDGVIHVLISQQPSISKETLSAIEAGEKKVDDPQRQITTRKLGAATVIEQRSVQAADPANKLPAMIRWTISIYVPDATQRFVPHQLDFLDLTAQQYENDRQLLEQMISSLRLAVSLTAGQQGR